MKEETVVTTNLDGLREYFQDGFLWCTKVDEEREEIFVAKEDYEDAAKRYGVPVELLEDIDGAFEHLLDELVVKLRKDLIDIWNEV